MRHPLRDHALVMWRRIPWFPLSYRSSVYCFRPTIDIRPHQIQSFDKTAWPPSESPLRTLRHRLPRLFDVMKSHRCNTNIKDQWLNALLIEGRNLRNIDTPVMESYFAGFSKLIVIAGVDITLDSVTRTTGLSLHLSGLLFTVYCWTHLFEKAPHT